jgi:hypothetical protein
VRSVHAAGQQQVRERLGRVASRRPGLAHDDRDRACRIVEEQPAHRGHGDELDVLGVVGVRGWRQVDAQREPEPAARPAAGGHQHE